MKLKLFLLFLVSFLFSYSGVAQDVSSQNDSSSNEEDELIQVVEEMPDFPGGTKELSLFLENNLNYPSEARESGVQGIVFVSFIVESDGHLSNVKVLRSLGSGCDEEAIRLVKSMPNWKPGKHRGAAVRVSYILPVKFKLN